MLFRRLTQSIFFGLCFVAMALSHAQSGSGTIYRLNDSASFQEGCFDPCLCPIGAAIPVRGTFILGPATPGNVVDFRSVSQINWTATFGDTVIHTISGTGVYRITNFDPDPQHSLDLELSIDGAPAQYFFSDFAPVSSSDGSIDLPVSINGIYCYDIVVRVDASPVPADEVTRYALATGSQYQVACFEPCDCVSQEPRPMRGHFQLVELVNFGTYAEYAIVDARFGVRSPSIVDAMLSLTGVGRYTLIQGFAGPAQEMDLSLLINGGGPLHFDQELENTTTQFPAIDIAVDLNEQICSDTVLTLKARPASLLNPATGIR